MAAGAGAGPAADHGRALTPGASTSFPLFPLLLVHHWDTPPGHASRTRLPDAPPGRAAGAPAARPRLQQEPRALLTEFVLENSYFFVKVSFMLARSVFITLL